MKSITIYKPDGQASFVVGAQVIKGEETTDVTVKSISVLFDRVKIKLSDGETLIFKGFPISIVK